MTHYPDYERRNSAREDAVHVIRDCNFSREVWEHFIPLKITINFSPLNLKDWLVRC